MENQATVIGAGLAGCEAAWQLAQAGVEVTLVEMKPIRFSPAHHSAGFAELVCSNSLKAERLASAAGLLKAEMQALGSLCVACAYESRVPAGGALAVDREQFSRLVTEQICAHARITVEHREATAVPKQGVTVIAAGPLASDALAGEIAALCGEALSFFDAAAPIVSADSVDMDCAFTQSRYGRGGEDDYINCPMDKEEYEAFYDALLHAESAPLHTFDKKKGVYEGCMPIEVMASRGADTMRFGPLKPVGLRDPRTGHRPWAVLQLRKENAGGTMYNLVGFQTNLKFGARVFDDPGAQKRGIPALRRDAPQYLSRFSAAVKRGLLYAQETGFVLCRADHRRGGLYGISRFRRPCRAQRSAQASWARPAGFAAGDDARRAGRLYQRSVGEEFSADGSKFRRTAAAGKAGS